MTTLRKPLRYGYKIKSTGAITYFENPAPITSVAMKGGGVRTQVYREFVEAAQEYGFLNGIEEVGGSSSGAITALFACIPYENPADRTRSLEYINQADTFYLGDSFGRDVYRFLTAPAYLVSKPAEWLSKGVNAVANFFNQSKPGMLIGVPLKIVAGAAYLASGATSPNAYEGVFNWAAYGSIYFTDKINERLNERLRDDVMKALNAMIKRVGATQEQKAIVSEFKKIGIIKNDLTLADPITFGHFAELAKMPQSQFKKYFTAGVRISDSEFQVFNAENTRDMPVKLAANIAMAFPHFFPIPEYKGEKYFDGGGKDNSLVRRGTKKWEKELDDKVGRLSVRVEYAEEAGFLWKQFKPKSGVLYQMKSWIFEQLAFGVDTYAARDEELEVTQRDFAHRSLQIPDFGVSRLEELTPEQRADMCKKARPFMDDFFVNHAGEKVAIQNFVDIQSMPGDMQINFYEFLRHNDVQNDDIFDFGFDFEPIRLTAIRKWYIQQLETTSAVKQFLSQPGERKSTTSLVFVETQKASGVAAEWKSSEVKDEPARKPVKAASQKEEDIQMPVFHPADASDEPKSKHPYQRLAS
jgi:hypothetical protein